MKKFLLVLPAAWLICSSFGQGMVPRNYAVEITATIQEAPPQIRLDWLPDSRAVSYAIARRTSISEAWQTNAVLSGDATQWTDGSVQTGVRYEYSIFKVAGGTDPYNGSGYIYAGIKAPLIEGRGKIILLVTDSLAGSLGSEIARLQTDMVGDGWQVLTHNVSETASPSDIKNILKSDYNSDPNTVRAAMFLGHVPVAYSGDLRPDGHPNHQGAWPADPYYADLTGEWTDFSVNDITNAEREINRNFPGDGKFDQSTIPTDVELEIGRVDLSSLTSFSNKTPSRNETDLTRQYLEKDHAFRMNQMQVDRRGLILDLTGIKDSGPLSDSAWRTFSVFFTPSQVDEVEANEYLPNVAAKSYLWTYASGGGSYTGCDGAVSSSDDFAISQVRAVFTMWTGSYFGDWNNESNFMRSSLGAMPSVLTACYVGYPNWFFHHMALGEHIGLGVRLTQNNSTNSFYYPAKQGAHQVHTTLLGDPTLRLHPVAVPSNVQAATGATGVLVSWNAVNESNLQGYAVYKAASSAGPFTRVNGAYAAGNSLVDASQTTSGTVYMVRAVKLEQTPSGTYYNPSQGAFGTYTGGTVTPPLVDLKLQGSITGTQGACRLQITGPQGKTCRVEYSTDFKSWTKLTDLFLTDGTSELTDTPGGNTRFYRLVLE